jgi:UrcA family protein
MKTILMSLAMLGVVAGTPVAASDVSIAYRDLDLATPAGQKVLDRRIKAAARAVCDLDEKKTGTRIREPEAIKCYHATLESARQRIAAIVDQSQKGG